jgi:uncharacterized membrane protein YoaK (UPF0700 family)
MSNSHTKEAVLIIIAAAAFIAAIILLSLFIEWGKANPFIAWLIVGILSALAVVITVYLVIKKLK